MTHISKVAPIGIDDFARIASKEKKLSICR
jgi:hypothetical protein